MNRRRLSLLVVLLAAALASGAHADLFQQAASADLLRSATGIITDTSELDPEPHWSFGGEFILACPVRCSMAAPEDIEFDLALTMWRPDGSASHSHNFTDFVASNVTVVGNDLIIDGTITGTTAVGPTTIQITIEAVPQQATFFVQFPNNAHILDPLGGVVVRSR